MKRVKVRMMLRDIINLMILNRRRKMKDTDVFSVEERIISSFQYKREDLFQIQDEYSKQNQVEFELRNNGQLFIVVTVINVSISITKFVKEIALFHEIDLDEAEAKKVSENVALLNQNSSLSSLLKEWRKIVPNKGTNRELRDITGELAWLLPLRTLKIYN